MRRMDGDESIVDVVRILTDAVIGVFDSDYLFLDILLDMCDYGYDLKRCAQLEMNEY